MIKNLIKKSLKFISKHLFSEINLKLSNIEYKQNLIMDYYLEAKDAKPATGNLRKFQKQDVDLLKEFIRICDKYNLRYWLDFGSLLGAVRHNGFIPWDDDCDVSMPESDFIKFQELAENEIAQNMQYLRWVENKMGRFVFKNDVLKSFLDIYAYKEEDDMLKTMLPFTNLYARIPVNKDMILPTKEIIFEDIKVKAPNNPKVYLSARYGNYNLLPKHPNYEIGHESINEHINVNNV